MDHKLRVSTMTQIGEFNSPIELDKLYEHLEITDKIKYIAHGSGKWKGEMIHKIKNPRKNKIKKHFYNQITFHIIFEKIINVKVFNNGRIQMTGLKYESQGIHTIKIVKDAINQLSNEKKESIFKTNNLECLWTKTVLINSDFDIGYKIDRETLHRLIIEAGYFSSFEACIYPGVNIKYYYNEMLQNKGICKCDCMCNGKGKNGECKKITIAVFNSGKIIITGGYSYQHIQVAYGFINNLIHSNKDILMMD